MNPKLANFGNNTTHPALKKIQAKVTIDDNIKTKFLVNHIALRISSIQVTNYIHYYPKSSIDYTSKMTTSSYKIQILNSYYISVLDLKSRDKWRISLRTKIY